MLGGCGAAPDCGKLRPCPVSSCSGRIGWAAGSGYQVLGCFLLWQRCCISIWIGLQRVPGRRTSLGWDFSLEMAHLHPGLESRGVLTHGLLGVGHVQQHDGTAGGLGRLSQGQMGIVYCEKTTSNMEGDKTQRGLVGRSPWSFRGRSQSPRRWKDSFYFPFSAVFG